MGTFLKKKQLKYSDTRQEICQRINELNLTKEFIEYMEGVERLKLLTLKQKVGPFDQTIDRLQLELPPIFNVKSPFPINLEKLEDYNLPCA